MAVTATGWMSDTLVRWRAFLATLSSVQLFLGAEDAEEAAESIFVGFAPGSQARPYVVVDFGEEGLPGLSIVGEGGPALAGGSLAVAIHVDVDADEVDDMLRVYNAMGGISLEALLSAARGVALVPRVMSMSASMLPVLMDESLREEAVGDAGVRLDHWRAVMTFGLAGADE